MKLKKKQNKNKEQGKMKRKRKINNWNNKKELRLYKKKINRKK